MNGASDFCSLNIHIVPRVHSHPLWPRTATQHEHVHCTLVHIWQLAAFDFMCASRLSELQHVSLLSSAYISIRSRSSSHLAAIYLDHWRDRVLNQICFLCVCFGESNQFGLLRARAANCTIVTIDCGRHTTRNAAVYLCPWNIDVWPYLVCVCIAFVITNCMRRSGKPNWSV